MSNPAPGPSKSAMPNFTMNGQPGKSATPGNGQRRATRPRVTPQGIIKFTKILLLVIAVWFAVLNIQPYIRLVDLLVQSGGGSGLQWLQSIPLVGWAVAKLVGLLTSFIAVLMWATIQVLELLPRILRKDMGSILALVQGLQQIQWLHIGDEDHPFVARLKAQHNHMPIRAIQKASVIASIVYLFDFVLCCVAYPPIRGGFEALGLFLQAPTFSDIDVGNLLMVGVVLFAVEIVYLGYNWLSNLLTMFGSRVVRPY